MSYKFVNVIEELFKTYTTHTTSITCIVIITPLRQLKFPNNHKHTMAKNQIYRDVNDIFMRIVDN